MSMFPPRVHFDMARSASEYWKSRARQHTKDSYAGVPMAKFPEDLRVYDHLLWVSNADTVIEVGARCGGSALWFRDRLRSYSAYRQSNHIRVISVDRDTSLAEHALQRVDTSFRDSITLVSADVRDPTLPAILADHVSPDARCMVVEDSAHVYETTMAALRSLNQFVPTGGFFVVEDGCVDIDEMRISRDWPRGVLPAISDWLSGSDGVEFVQRRDLELYGLTCHPGGYLQRIS